MGLKIKNEADFHHKTKSLTEIQSGDRLLTTDLNFKKKDGRFYHWLKVFFSFLPGDRFSKTRIYNVAAVIGEFYKTHQNWCSADDKKDLNSVLTYLEKISDKSKNKKLKTRNKDAIKKARDIILSQTQNEVKNPNQGHSDLKNQDPKEGQDKNFEDKGHKEPKETEKDSPLKSNEHENELMKEKSQNKGLETKENKESPIKAQGKDSPVKGNEDKGKKEPTKKEEQKVSTVKDKSDDQKDQAVKVSTGSNEDMTPEKAAISFASGNENERKKILTRFFLDFKNDDPSFVKSLGEIASKMNPSEIVDELSNSLKPLQKKQIAEVLNSIPSENLNKAIEYAAKEKKLSPEFIKTFELQDDELIYFALPFITDGEDFKLVWDSIDDKLDFLFQLDDEQFAKLTILIKSEGHIKIYNFLQKLNNLQDEDQLSRYKTFINAGEKLDPIQFIEDLKKVELYWSAVLNKFSQVRVNLFATEILTISKSLEPNDSKGDQIARLLNNLDSTSGQPNEKTSIGEVLANECNVEDISHIMHGFLKHTGTKQRLGEGFILNIMKNGNPDAIRSCLSSYWSNQNEYTTQDPSLLMKLLPSIDTEEKLDIAIQTLKSSNIRADEDIIKMFTKGIPYFDFGTPETYKVRLKEEEIVSILKKNNIPEEVDVGH